MKDSVQERGTLVLSFIAGLSINGTFSVLFSSIVPFSIFPVVSLVLAVWCLHSRYQHRTMPAGLPGLAAASFVLGLLAYSSVVRAEYPEMGSNFLPSILFVIVLFWVVSRLRARKMTLSE